MPRKGKSAFELNVESGLRRGLTQEQAEERARGFQESNARFVKAYAAVVADAGGQRGIRGTEGCMAWMQ